RRFHRRLRRHVLVDVAEPAAYGGAPVGVRDRQESGGAAAQEDCRSTASGLQPGAGYGTDRTPVLQSAVRHGSVGESRMRTFSFYVKPKWKRSHFWPTKWERFH